MESHDCPRPYETQHLKNVAIFFPFCCLFFISCRFFSFFLVFLFLTLSLLFFVFSSFFPLSPIPMSISYLVDGVFSIHFLTSIFLLLFVCSICPFLFPSPSSSFIFIFFICFSFFFVNVLISPLPLASSCVALYLFPSLTVVRAIAFEGFSAGLISLLFLTVAVLTMIIFTEYG